MPGAAGEAVAHPPRPCGRCRSCRPGHLRTRPRPGPGPAGLRRAQHGSGRPEPGEPGEDTPSGRGVGGGGQAGRASAAHAHSARESTSSGFTFQKMSSLRDKGHVRSAPTALGGGAGRGHRASLRVWALTPSQPRRHCARVFASPFFHLTNEDNNVTRLQETV